MVVLDEAISAQLAQKAKALGMDEAALAAWCVQTGLLLEDLNAFVRARLAGEVRVPCRRPKRVGPGIRTLLSVPEGISSLQLHRTPGTGGTRRGPCGTAPDGGAG
jgi:hypothetical protein